MELMRIMVICVERILIISRLRRTMGKVRENNRAKKNNKIMGQVLSESASCRVTSVVFG